MPQEGETQTAGRRASFRAWYLERVSLLSPAFKAMLSGLQGGLCLMSKSKRNFPEEVHWLPASPLHLPVVGKLKIESVSMVMAAQAKQRN